MANGADPASQPGLPFPERPASGDAKPFIKWAGGKRQLLPELRRFVPASYGTYYEPFVGGAALFFGVLPKNAMLSDLNERLVRTYCGVADDVDRVIELLSQWPHELRFFQEKRKVDTALMTDAEVAAWFIYLNRTAFNGLYRVNRQNQFNVPFGRYANPTICDEQGLRAASEALRARARFRLCDFEEAVRPAKAGDFVYFDPPYVPISEYSDFARYTSEAFGVAEHERLRDVALALKKRGVSVLLSNSSAPLVYDLYAGEFEVYSVSARRAVSGKVGGRSAVTEVIIR